jgi:4-amino-4-deoxy-L-arabinose transferase-like glycosyltransferase
MMTRAVARPRQTLDWGSALNSVAALLAATFFRALPLLENRFHPDEALYASFGRLIASGRDPLLAGVVVDKPPLSFYLSAGSFLLLGGTEFAARLVPFYASIVSVALLFALARRLYGPLAAHLAAWGLALSPFAILFSITIFIDPLLVALGLWAVVMFVACGRRRAASLRMEWTGAVAFALAFATKQTALVFAPLALALMLPAMPAAPGLALRRLLRAGLFIAGGLAVSALVVFAWDAARHAPIGFWQQGYADNTPGRFIRVNEIWPRALAWLDWLHYITASSPLNVAAWLGVPVLLGAGVWRPTRATLADFILAGFLLLYLAAYWLLAFNVWDRYLLPVVPLIVLLLGRLVAWASAGLARAWAGGVGRLGPRWVPQWGGRFFLPVLLVGLLLPPAFTAARSGYPVGGDHGAYDGLDDAARFIRTLPTGGVLYDHWLGWQWNFYLFDGPLYVSWFISPEALATDLRAFGHTSPRYLAVPAWESDVEVRAAAAEAGFGFTLLHTSYRRDGLVSIVVYQLTPSP